METMGLALSGTRKFCLGIITGVQLKRLEDIFNKRGIGAATQDENTVMFHKQIIRK